MHATRHGDKRRERERRRDGRRRAVVALALVCIAAPAWPQDVPRILDVRTGVHESFDRLVLDLDRTVPIRWREEGREPATLLVGATAPFAEQIVGSERARMGQIAIRRRDGETLVELPRGDRRVRVFAIEDPPRLVIDVARPGRGVFAAPSGTVAIHPLEHEPPEEDETAAAERVRQLRPPRPAPAPPGPRDALPPRPEIVGGPTGPSVPAPPAPAPAPAPPSTAAPPGPPDAGAGPPGASAPVARVPAPVPPVPEATPGTAPAPPPPAPEPGAGFPWAWLAAGLLLAAGVWFAATRLGGRGVSAADEKEDAASAGSPHTITPAELLGGAERVDILEKRIDEERRARVELEGRVGQLLEEHKVLRDRIARLVRAAGREG